MIEIDIATRVVGPAEDMYIVRAGADFAFYDEFDKRSEVFLDFPSLGMRPGEKFPDRDDARAMVARSLAISEWVAWGRVDAEPSRDLNHYKREIAGRRLGRYVAAIKRLIFDLPVGSIIVVPGSGFYSNVLIGEITGPSREVEVKGYKGETVLARPVRWVAKRPKNTFSPEFGEALKARRSVTVLDRSLREEVLRAGYGQYVIGDLYTARLETVSADFSTLDDYDIQTIINFVAGAIAACDEGFEDEGQLSLLRALEFLRARRDIVPEFKSNINSPGFLRMFAEGTVPIAIAVVITAALHGVALADGIKVTNSKAPPGDPCAMRVEQQVKDSVRLMRLDDLQQACKQIVEAQKDTGVKTSLKVTPVKPRAKP